MDFVLNATLCLKPWVDFTTSVPVKSCVLLSPKRIFNVVARRESWMHWDDTIYKKKASILLKCRSGNEDCAKQPILLSTMSEITFPHRRSLADEQLLQEMKEGKLSGYLQCEFEYPKNLRLKFVNFPPLFQNTLVSKSDIRNLMKNSAEEKGLLTQPRKMLISIVILQKGTLITPLLLFYLQLGLVCTKIHCFVEYKAKKCFNSFVQSAVYARRQCDENPISSVVAETMKFLAKSSYGYQIRDRGQHTVTKALTDKKHKRPLIVNCSKR